MLGKREGGRGVERADDRETTRREWKGRGWSEEERCV